MVDEMLCLKFILVDFLQFYFWSFKSDTCRIEWNINCGIYPSGYHSEIAQEWSFSNGKVSGLIPDSVNIFTCLFIHNLAFFPWFSDVNCGLNVVVKSNLS